MFAPHCLDIFDRQGWLGVVQLCCNHLDIKNVSSFTDKYSRRCLLHSFTCLLCCYLIVARDELSSFQFTLQANAVMVLIRLIISGLGPNSKQWIDIFCWGEWSVWMKSEKSNPKMDFVEYKRDRSVVGRFNFIFCFSTLSMFV